MTPITQCATIKGKRSLLLQRVCVCARAYLHTHRAGFLSICFDGEQCECVCVHASKRVCIIYHPRNVFSPLSICIYLQLLSEVATQEVKPTARFTSKPVRRTNGVSQSVPTCSGRHRQSWERDVRQTRKDGTQTSPAWSGYTGKRSGLGSRLVVMDTSVRSAHLSARSSCTLKLLLTFSNRIPQCCAAYQ